MKADGKHTRLVVNKEAVLKILQQVIDDPSRASSYFKEWPSSVQETSSEFSAAWGALEHFCNDADLRKTDSEYEKILLKQIAQILTDLQNSQ